MGCWNDIVSGTRYSFKALGDLFFPRKCAVCQTILACEERNICDDCRNDIPYTWFWSWPENPAEERMWSKVGIESATSLFFYRYTGGYGHILHKFKYRCNIPLGLAIGQDLGKKMANGGRFKDIDAIVPVPLHWRRRWHRGFNQAEIVARGVAEGFALGSGEKTIPLISHLVKRIKMTTTQTRLTGKEKAENVKNAFHMEEKIALRLLSKGINHILLVDDVLTSGSTLAACATPLMKYFRVSVATIGFVE